MNIIIAIIAAVELVAPVQDSTVRLISDGQRAVITNETLAARESVFAADRKLGKKIRHDRYWRKSLPVVFAWNPTKGEKGPWEILISKNSDMSDARKFLFAATKIDKDLDRKLGPKNSTNEQRHVLSCLNLEIATRYYWQVTSIRNKYGHERKCTCKNCRPAIVSEVGTFVTEDLAPRWIGIEGTTGNFRDLGGRIGLNGRRVKQGLVYRSQGLNCNSVDGVVKGKNRLTVSDVEYLTGTLRIKTDLDLRSTAEAAGLNGVSPMGGRVNFINRSSHCYRGIFNSDGKKIMAENFREFLKRENYPILFHCIGGADRTGALGYVLNGVLGVKRQELETDWESTFYPDIPDQVHSNEPDWWCRESHFNEGFGKYGDANASWNDRIVLYLKDCGITDAEIEEFRGIMLQ